MLKHVQISPMRNRADSLSLRSSTASSCASSMCGSPEPPTELQRTPSRASSYTSLNEQLPQTTIKVYTNCLKIDIEYKTLGIQWDTTSKEVISQLLRRLKMRHRDPRLFYLSMEVSVRRAGVKTILVLDDDTRPAILQACHPKGESRFCLQLRPGGLIRVHTSALQPSSQYKSLVISEETTSDELLHLLLGCYSSPEPVEQFSIYEVCPGQEYQRKLHPDDIPLRAQAERMKRGETCHFLVRRNPNYARRRQLLANLNEAMHKSYDTHSMHSTSLEDIDENSLLDLSIESLSDDLHSLAMLTSDEDEDCASSASSSGSSDTSTECATISNTTKTVTLRQATNKLITNVAAAAAAAGQGNNTNAMSATATATSPSLSLSAKASTICLKCRNNFKSCEFCQQNSALIAAQTLNQQQQQQQHATANATTCNAQSPPRGYSPVYNIREIRTATHSFSALGKDKKLLDIHLNARFDAACRIQRPQSLYLGTSCNSHMSADANGNGGGVSTATPVTMAATDVNGNATTNVATTVAGEAVNNNPAKGLGHFVYL